MKIFKCKVQALKDVMKAESTTMEALPSLIAHSNADRVLALSKL